MDSFKLALAEQLLYENLPISEDLQISLLKHIVMWRPQYIYEGGNIDDKYKYWFKKLNGRKLRLAKLLLPQLTTKHSSAEVLKRGMVKHHG